MSDRYNFNPLESSVAFEVFPKGDVEVQLGEPKSFKRTNQAGNENFGIRISSKISAVPSDYADQNAVGKRLMINCYLHTDGAKDYSKQVMLAALGYKTNSAGEREFNEKYGAADWSFDPDSGSVGDAWRQMTGCTMVVSLDVVPNRDDPTVQMQNIAGFRPVG